MIENHFGKPGSGKSYGVFSEVILPALKAGNRVLTNIDGVSDKGCRLRLAAHLCLSPDELDERYVSLSEDEIISGACWGYVRAGDTYVIDEVQRYWPGGVLKPTDPTGFKFFGEHRHFGCHIHCITINPGNFQSPMRAYAECSHLYKKLGVLGLNSRYIRRDYAAAVPSPDAEVHSQVGKYRKEIFSFYKSVTEDGNNVVGKQRNILLQPKILIGLLIVLVGLPILAWRIHKKGVIPVTQTKTYHFDTLAPANAPARPSRSLLGNDQELSSYSVYGCIDDGSVCYLRLADGSVQLLPAVRQPGGLVYHDGRAFLPGGTR